MLVLVLLAVIVIIALFYPYSRRGDDSQQTNESGGNDNDDTFTEVNLQTFEQFYRSTIWQTRKLRSDYDDGAIMRVFVDDKNRIFEDLRPFDDANDFANLLKSLTAYAVYMSIVNAEEVRINIAAHLHYALSAIDSKLPSPAPSQRLPWNYGNEHWHVFSVALTECAMLLSIMLRPYIDVSEIAVRIIDNYLTGPNLSMGWRRGIGFSTRMCLPYIYARLNMGHDPYEIVALPPTGSILDEIRHNARFTGSGIRTDFINFVDTNVRNYSFLVENYFTFAYYNFLFGRDFVRMDNVHTSIHLVGSDIGIIHPALAFKNGTHLWPALGEIMSFEKGVYSADFSKVVTVRNENYYGSVVCPTNGVAYYQANYDYRGHALLWSMTKRIWSNNAYHYFPHANLDTGVLLLVADDIDIVLPNDDVLLSPNTAMSFLPNPGFTGIATTDDCAAVASFSKFDALNVEYYSYTLYYRNGMVQLYDKIKALSALDHDAYCVILLNKFLKKHDDDDDDDNSNFVDDNSTLDVHSAQGCIARHHNIENYKSLPKFVIKTRKAASFSCQPLPMAEINDGSATACYSMTTLPNASVPSVVKLERLMFKVNAGEVVAVFDFPFVIVKNNDKRRVTINSAYTVSKTLHTIHFDEIKKLLQHINLRVDDLMSDTIKRTDYAFVYENSQTNQFKFKY
ncbi:ODV-E66 [Agrotis segetum nucleopolyhedrovirus A]|uniref:ODV-E66 n=1 Tax=Agrotis segetum nuclear polyhedrosis virus TaxID=1962501 RepID=Q287E7_NPVAS|nr:ODV-E66 [Agrotis segetum nucleopolyhedrovirus A]AAZ38291.1 ODV-E66 [Agrotis segetum nucleopolyhedrovirus A]